MHGLVPGLIKSSMRDEEIIILLFHAQQDEALTIVQFNQDMFAVYTEPFTKQKKKKKNGFI